MKLEGDVEGATHSLDYTLQCPTGPPTPARRCVASGSCPEQEIAENHGLWAVLSGKNRRFRGAFRASEASCQKAYVES